MRLLDKKIKFQLLLKHAHKEISTYYLKQGNLNFVEI